ncbi:hypothetical protein CCR75_004243 [Bremia lactucae]|uniref:Uncharacterized protein n=1 Tax=Bremia lactucae TaxID=4779 RepID=A0A976FPR9_BRELC|nr:hypothetical protein CCR75_004243 [Bremia lactucae]
MAISRRKILPTAHNPTDRRWVLRQASFPDPLLQTSTILKHEKRLHSKHAQGFFFLEHGSCLSKIRLFCCRKCTEKAWAVL